MKRLLYFLFQLFQEIQLTLSPYLSRSKSSDFDQLLNKIVRSAKGYAVGYTYKEIKKIERLYDIKISGDLEKFLLKIGRSAGNVLSDVELIFYKGHMKLRDHLITQFACCEELIVANAVDMWLQKPFFISMEETWSYFLLTDSDYPEEIYLYDDNTDTIRKIDWTFAEYIEHQASEEVRSRYNDLVVRSDLLLI